METYGVKYIGSKKTLLKHIGDVFDGLEAKTALDAFSGTTRVAQYLRQKGIQTTTSDLSWATTAYANTYVHNGNNSHLQEFVDAMNAVDPVRGWLSENYTGDTPQDHPRGDGRCFQLMNTMKADAARDYIETLDLEPWEKHTLITALIRGLDAVDNTVGIQQAYLKEWCSRSFKPVRFELPVCLEGPTATHHEGDTLKIAYGGHDVVYLDPPYSPHPYSTYYHIWDSIARWDKPETALKAKRRVDRVAKHDQFDETMQSPWNRASKAAEAFDQLLGRLDTNHFVISYSNESIVNEEQLLDICASHGSVNLFKIDYGRNIMSQIGNAKLHQEPEVGQRNKELLITVSRTN